MNWSKVFYTFFTLMSLTTTAGYLYEQNEIALFIAGGINLISTFLKIGVKNTISTEFFASSLVADLHLIPAFVVLEVYENPSLAYSLAIGAIIANTVSMFLLLIEVSKSRDEF